MLLPWVYRKPQPTRRDEWFRTRPSLLVAIIQLRIEAERMGKSPIIINNKEN